MRSRDWSSDVCSSDLLRPNPEDVVIGMRDAATRSRWLAEALGELSDRERIIIARRRLEEDGATLEQLGSELGVSKERTRQPKSLARNKLKASLLKRTGDVQRMPWGSSPPALGTHEG